MWFTSAVLVGWLADYMDNFRNSTGDVMESRRNLAGAACVVCGTGFFVSGRAHKATPCGDNDEAAGRNLQEGPSTCNGL